MDRKKIISVPQLFSMLFISRMVVDVTYSSSITQSTDIWDHILSAGISFLITFLLVIPIYFLFGMDSSKDIADTSISIMGKVGIIIVLIYAFYYILVCTFTLNIFTNFISNVINPPISIPFLAFAVILSSSYGASRGIEALARSSVILLVIICLFTFLIGISLSAGIEKVNYPPFLYNGTNSMINGVLFMISRTSCIPALTMLLPYAKGNIKKGILFWNLSIYAVIAILIFLIVGSLGDFQSTQLFPVYTATSIAKIGPLEHLDAFYLGIWTTGIFVKMSLFLMLASKCVKRVLGEAAGKGSVLWIAIGVWIWSLVSKNLYDSSWLFSTNVLLSIMLITSIVLPLILIFIKLIKNKGGSFKIEN